VFHLHRTRCYRASYATKWRLVLVKDYSVRSIKILSRPVVCKWLHQALNKISVSSVPTLWGSFLFLCNGPTCPLNVSIFCLSKQLELPTCTFFAFILCLSKMLYWMVSMGLPNLPPLSLKTLKASLVLWDKAFYHILPLRLRFVT
jgi:hypothetical protein